MGIIATPIIHIAMEPIHPSNMPSLGGMRLLNMADHLHGVDGEEGVGEHVLGMVEEGVGEHMMGMVEEDEGMQGCRGLNIHGDLR